MKVALILAALAACAVGQQQRQQQQQQRVNPRSEDIQILRYENENNGDGTYSYAYETSDGTSAAQKGYLKPPPAGSEDPIQVAEGFFQYVSPEGEQFKLDYVADENGFQPKADHLPTSPPIPEAIAKMLELIYKNAGDQIQRAASASASNQRQTFQPQSSFQRQQPRFNRF